MSPLSLIDLSSKAHSLQDFYSDVCVIGGGAAGIYVAYRLAVKGLDVVLLEAGGLPTRDHSEAGFECAFSGMPYRGATRGRFFGLGGSTSRWGGVLIPYMPHDMRANQPHNDVWAHIIQTVVRNTRQVLQTLGFAEDPEFTGFPRRHLGSVYGKLKEAGLEVVSDLALPFRRRNLTWLLYRLRNARCARLTVFVNSLVQAWEVETDAGSQPRVRSIIATSVNGNKLQVRAQKFVIAAGALESARLLLELNRQSSRPVIRSTSAVGCYLSDHLSIPIAEVPKSAIQDIARLFAPRFYRGWLRRFRLLEADPPPDAPRGFCHFVIDAEDDPGWMLMKQLLESVQERRWPRVRWSELVQSFNSIWRLARDRYVKSVLYVPPNARVYLQLDIEQIPMRANRITLDKRLDRYGRAVPRIHWKIHDTDISAIQETAERILGKWLGSKAGLPELIPKTIDFQETKPHDTYHPVGVCRLGNDSEAVVDENLKVWGLENVWLISTGIFPSAGSANPTFSMLCFAESLAAHLAS